MGKNMDSSLKYGNLLLTTDFSDLSARAIPHAVSIARKYKSKIYILHVLEPILSPVEYSWGSVQVEQIEDSRHSNADKNLLKWCDEQLSEDLDTRILIRKGNAVTEIISVIEEFDINMVFMATHCHTGISHVIFGSTTSHILKKSPIPVLSIR